MEGTARDRLTHARVAHGQDHLDWHGRASNPRFSLLAALKYVPEGWADSEKGDSTADFCERCGITTCECQSRLEKKERIEKIAFGTCERNLGLSKHKTQEKVITIAATGESPASHSAADLYKGNTCGT